MKYKPYRPLLFAIAKIIACAIYPLPLKLSVNIGAFLGRLAFYLLAKERRKTLAHLKMAFGNEKTDGELERIAASLFSNLGRNVAEWINFPKITPAWFEKNVTADGLENLNNARKKNKGIIILASHFGNWELMAAYFTHVGYRGVLIVRKIYIEQFNDFFVKLRKRWGNDIIYRDESPKKVLRVLKSNGVIGILPDQDVNSVEGVFVDFFGVPAYTPAAPVKLAMKSGASLIPTFLIREGSRFRFVVEKEVEIDSGEDKERDILVNTVRWTRVLEKYIRAYPDQWVWMHRRWKTRPNTVTSYQMQMIDRIAEERFGIPGMQLMENAGEAVASCVLSRLNSGKERNRVKRVAVFCGKGNNGGDGLVVSRILIKNNCDVVTYITCGPDELKDSPASNLKLLQELGGTVITLKNKDDAETIEDLINYNIIVDAIFGTGFKGKPDELISGLIDKINACGTEIISVDVPSGLNATTGGCEGVCIRAAETVTFGLPKSGFYTDEGPKYTGKIIVKNIGFPDSLLKEPPPSIS